MNHELIIQLIGFTGLILGALSYQFNNRLKILDLQMAAALMWTLHYGFLGAYTGSAMNLLTAGRSYTYYRAGKRRHLIIPVLIGTAFIIAAGLTWQSNYSALPLAGSLIGTIALWQTKTAHIRWVILFGPLCWITYNLKVSHSVPALCSDIFNTSSIILAIYRFDVAPRLRKHNHKLRKLTLQKA